MAFELNVQYYVPTTEESRDQSRQVCALMGLPEDAGLMPEVDVQAFRNGQASVVVRIAKMLSPEEYRTLQLILGLEPSFLVGTKL